MRQADVNQVREVLGNYVGQRVKVKANMGRHRYNISEGVILETYPSIFTIKLKNDDTSKNARDKFVSYSYTDVLTKDVQLTVFN